MSNEEKEAVESFIKSLDSFEDAAKDSEVSKYSGDYRCPNCGAYSDHGRTLILMGDLLPEDPGISWPEGHKCNCGQVYHFINGA